MENYLPFSRLRLNTKCNWIDLNDAAKDSLKDIDMLESEKATELRWHEVFNDYLTKIFDRIKECYHSSLRRN